MYVQLCLLPHLLAALPAVSFSRFFACLLTSPHKFQL